MAYLNPEVYIIGAEADFCRRFGRTSADTCGRKLYEFLHPSAQTPLSRHFDRLNEGRCNRFTERVVGLGDAGRTFSGDLTGIPVQSVTGSLSGIVVQVSPDVQTAPGEHAGGMLAANNSLSLLDAQILEGIAAGASTQQLANRLYLSRQGVEYHVGLMLRKLRAPNRAAMVARAHSLGMLAADQWPPRVPAQFVKDFAPQGA